MYDDAKFKKTIKWLDSVAKTPTRRHDALQAKEFISQYVEYAEEELCQQALDKRAEAGFTNYIEEKLIETEEALKYESQWLSYASIRHMALKDFAEETLATVKIVKQIVSTLSVYGKQSEKRVEIMQQLLDGIEKSLHDNKRKAESAIKALTKEEPADAF